MHFREKINLLAAKDITVIFFNLFLILMNIIFFQRVEQSSILIAIELFTIILIFTSAYFHDTVKSMFWKLIHQWYPVPLIFITFKQLYYMVHPIHPTDYDLLLISIDRFIFGVNPTHFLSTFTPRALTELLQIVYHSFYFLPIILGINLVRNKRYFEFDYSVFMIVHAFFLSYLGYFSLPAIGPRFTLHDFYSINNELPGLFITNFLREIVNSGESISSTMKNAAQLVQRDVFPSGHTQITLVVMYLSYKLKSKTTFFIVPCGSMLIFSTVYLRYHYVVDLIGGGVFAVLTFWTGNLLYNKWNNYTKKNFSS